MRLRSLFVVIVICFVAITTWVSTPPALALTQIKLSNISYQECPPELAQGAVTSGATNAANCFIVTGKAVKEKQVEKAVELSAEKYCSASKMLSDGGVEITHDFEIVETAEA